MDYYDYGPRVVLERPVALVGFLGSGVREVAHELSARLGLPLHDVDRMVEHHAGQSLAALQLERGVLVRRAFEKRCLAQALRGTPPGVLALGDGLLIDERNRRLVSESATLVLLERPLAEARVRLTRSLKQEPGRHPEFVVAGLPAEDGPLEVMLAQREPGYRTADRRVQAATLRDSEVVAAVIEQLRLL